MNNEVLILGGTGAMGGYLVDILIQKGFYVSVTSRRPQEKKDKVNFLIGNAKDKNFLFPLLRKKRWFAIIDFMIYSTEDFEKIVINILDATDQYVYLSSARVFAETKYRIKEDSQRLLDVLVDKEYLATDEYALAKARQENILQSSNCKNWTIIRPYITFSDFRLQFGVLEKEDWLFRVLNNKKIIFPEELMGKRTTLTHGLDVAKGIASIVGQSYALGEIFNIANSEYLTWEKVFAVYSKILNDQLNIRPEILLVSNSDFLICHPAKYQLLYDRIYDRCFDSSKIEKVLPKSEFSNPLEGLECCLKNFLNNPVFLPLSAGLHARKDKYEKSFTSISHFRSVRSKFSYLKNRFF